MMFVCVLFVRVNTIVSRVRGRKSDVKVEMERGERDRDRVMNENSVLLVFHARSREMKREFISWRRKKKAHVRPDSDFQLYYD